MRNLPDYERFVHESKGQDLYSWCAANKLELTADAIAYFFSGDKSEENPFAPKGGFYRLGYTKLRDGQNPVHQWWSEWLFDNETAIAGAYSDYRITDVRTFNSMLDQFREWEKKSFAEMGGRADR